MQANDNLKKIVIYLFIYVGPPNITTSFETNIKDRSVKLIGNVFVYDDSPGILDTFWTKNPEQIKTEENSGKLLEGNIDSPTLIIKNVSPDDDGEYQLTAKNAVGTSTSDVIVIGISVIHIVNYHQTLTVQRLVSRATVLQI